jgi:thiol-disulfide isomerase/thioredoxin
MRQLFSLLFFLFLLNTSFGQSKIAIGETCPNFIISDTHGVSHNLYDICDAGQYVVLNFYTHWCGPCMQTAPILHEFYTKYGCNSGDVFVLGVECDQSTTTTQIQSFKSTCGLPAKSFPNALTSQIGSELKIHFGISSFPTVVIIGPDKKMLNNDIYPLNNLFSLEKAFPAGALLEMPCATAGINQNAIHNNLNVYPNPVYDILNVKIENMQNIAIHDAMGKLVLDMNFKNTNELELNLSHFDKGLYIITIATLNGVVHARFVKE